MISAGDVAAVAEAAWTAAGFSSGAVPGGLGSGRLPAATDATNGLRAMPYALLSVAPGGDQEFYPGLKSAQPYRTSFRVTFELYGVGKTALDAVLKSVAAVLGLDENWSFASPSYLIGVWLEDDGARLEEEESQRSGDDIWKATLSYRVAVGGTLP